MFDPQFRLSPDLLGNGTTSDDSSGNGPWPQMSLDRLLEHHDLTPGKPISMKETNNDFWSSSAQFKDFFNNYHQQYQQQNQPIDIASLISSSPPQHQQHQQQQQQQQQQHFPLPLVDNHIFEPPQDSQPRFFNQYLPDHNRMSSRQDSIPQQYTHRSRQHYHHAPPVLQIPNEDPYQQAMGQQRYKQQQPPAYVACLNHGINYNGVSGPPILLPPSF